jgi:LacI family transcriptional regulator
MIKSAGVATAKSMKVNQDEIAKRLGISRTTVSRSFSNYPGINSETRARVLALAEELGYRYSVPRSGRIRERLRASTIGVLIGTPRFEHQIAYTFQSILKGISERAVTDRISLDVSYVDPAQLDVKSRDSIILQRIRSGHWSGMILIYPFREESIRTLAKIRPVVSIVEDYPDCGVDCIDTDQANGVFGLIRHLNTLGHKRIGYLTWHYPVEAPWCHLRFGAYVESLLRLDLEYNSAWVINARRSSHVNVPDISEMVANRIRADGVTAWVCAADHQAYTLIKDLEKYGIRVPEDCSVTGFDGIEVPAGLLPLTTVGVPYEEMGISSVIRLVGRIQDNSAPRRHNLVAGRLVVGQTTAPARHGGFVA